MFYAEKWGVSSENKSFISDRGVFLSVSEFVPFRENGWSASAENDMLADEQIDLRKKTTESLAYIARMQCGTKERIELCRRNKERTSCA